MKDPNFFIIGAPKCGTTSLSAWLSKHPDIFLPSFKEPHFFNTDHNFVNTPDWDHYLRLFYQARPRHSAVGEASVWYLYSEQAVPDILDSFPKAKFIVMLRNPVQMAYSLHEQQCYSGMEHIKNFEAAWEAQAERRLGRNIHSFCREPKHLLYGEACKLGKQMERLYRKAPGEQVLPVLLEDLKINAREQYLRILHFLEIADDGRTHFPVKNSAKARYLPGLTRLIGSLNSLKNKMGIWNRGLGILSGLDAMNTRYRPRPPMREETRKRLKAYFASDTTRLESILHRDLKELWP